MRYAAAASQLMEINYPVQSNVNFNITSGSTSPLFQYFVLNAKSTENKCSQTCIMEKSIWYFTVI
jgi:hypothetical protein